MRNNSLRRNWAYPKLLPLIFGDSLLVNLTAYLGYQDRAGMIGQGMMAASTWFNHFIKAAAASG